MIKKQDIEKLANDYLKDGDKFLVEIKIKPGNKIFVFIDSDTQLTIQDCVDLSRHIESSLDRDTEDFELNVSSSGLDQPLKLPRQYNKLLNKKIRLLFNDGKKVEGILREFDGKTLNLLIEKSKKNKEEKNIKAELSDIKEAKAVISFN